MFKLIKAIMPRSDNFFDLFEAQAKKAQEAAATLRAILEGGDKTADLCTRLSSQEEEADHISYEVMQSIRRSFITPFDRSDIKALSSALDDAIDQMNKAGRIIMLYEVREFDPLMREMGDIIVKAAEITAQAVPLLQALGPQVGQLGALTEEVTRLEGRSDELHEEGLRQLYRTHGKSDPMAYIIGSEVYSRLEKVVDSLEDVADKISAIVIEHV